jgi:iron complex outermembrane receptor protein
MRKFTYLCSRLSLYSALIGGTVCSTSLYGQDDEDLEVLSAVSVTGSRMSLADFEGGFPVNVYTSEDIEQTPQLSLNSYLRFIPTSYGSGNIDESFVNGGDGRATIGLRGLPTLTLINGRRTATADLNVLPVAAIDRVEILKDGNGAVYGADAVGGVINIITKKRYEGVTLSANYKNTFDADISQRDFSVVYGSISDRSSVLLALSYFKQNDLFSSDRDEITNTSNREFTATSSTPNPGRFQFPADYFFPGSPAGFYRVDNDVTVATSPSDFRLGQYGQGDPATSDRFPFSIYTPAVRPAERYNIFASAEYDVFEDSNAAKVYTDVMYTRSKSQAGLAPSPSSVTVPADNYWNQQIFGANAIELAGSPYRFLDFGPRLNDVRFDDYAITLGIKGELFEDRLSYDASWFFNANDQLDEERNGVNRTRLAEVMNGENPAFTGANSFNPFTNPFDSGVVSNNQAVLDYIKLEPRTQRNYETEIKNITLTGKVMETSAGWITALGGFEQRREFFERIPDLAKQEAAGSGWNGTTAVTSEYETDSFFGELVVPILQGVSGAESLQVGVAARREKFSHLDNSDTTIYRAFTRYQPIKELTIRGSYSEGYTVPTPLDLDPSSFQGFPNIFMPWLGVPDQTEEGAEYVGNANLQPTESKSYNLGFVYAPEALPGFSVTVDYNRIEQSNIIVQDAQLYVDAFALGGGISVAGTDANGNPNLFTKDNSAPYASQIDVDLDGSITGIPGYIVEIRGVRVENIAEREAESLDMEVRYDFETDTMGTFDLRLNLTHVLSYQITKIPGALPAFDYDGVFTPNDDVGPVSVPKWRGFLQGTWSYAGFNVTPRINYTHSYDEDPLGGTDFTSEIDAWITADILVSYTFEEWGTTLRVGIENLTDEMPPIAKSSFADNYDRATHNILGRMFTVGLTQEF